MRRSIFLKTFLALLGIMALVALLVFLFSSSIVRRQNLEGVHRGLGQLASSLERNFAPLLASGEEKELDALAKELGRETGVRLTVIARDGRVLADSQGDPRRMESHADRPEFILALQGRPAEFTRVSSTLRRAMLYQAVPLRGGERVAGVLRLSLFESSIEQALAANHRRISLFLAVLLALALAAAFWFARGLTVPIRRLTRAAQQVAGGDFSPRVRIRGRDELRQLADTFNHMVERQQALLESVRRQELELETVLASIAEGLLVLDPDGRIVLANQSFLALCRQPECQGRPYWEALRDARLDDLITRARASRRETGSELDLLDRSYQVRVSPIPGQERIVVTFSDVSEYKRLETIKRDFVGNLSHELRTPLTAIKGFLETAAEEGTPESRRYLEIVLRHTDRLVSLVNDLLTLAETEEPRVPVPRTRVDLRRLADDIALLFAGRCREKGIRIDVAAGPDLPPFFGDPIRLEQLLINLVDNAVKYTERGGIRISLAAREKEFTIRVRDSGIGIPAEDLPRIFERFFVVDKARSRRSGGTGLGLSIVKHIVRLHGGRIDVTSAPGEGTEFTVTLPPAAGD